MAAPSKNTGGVRVPALGDALAASERERELEATCQRLQRSLASKEGRDTALLAAVHQAARDAAVITGVWPAVTAPPRMKRRGEAALIHLTDWQLGKLTETYTPDVCEQRVRTAVEKALTLTEIQRADHPVTDCHVMLGGDLVEGATIFPGQAWAVDTGAFEQVFRVAALVEMVVASLLAEYQSVTVWEVTGNHGRLGRKGDHPREDNLDAIAGRIARERLTQQPRLTWHPPTSWHQIVEVGAYHAMLVHGDQVKSFGGGLPAFGIMRKATAWASGVVPDFADLYMGHFHSEMTLTMPNGGRAYMTPSTESGSEYAREFVAAKGRPGQRLHFIDPARGRVTAQYILDLS